MMAETAMDTLERPATGAEIDGEEEGLFDVVRPHLLRVAWVQALVATGGSLYFSEVMHFVPCPLCWYQRILMYPLVLILGVGILRRDPGARAYALPLSVLGWLIAGYHCLLQYGVISESDACAVGISCTTPWINWFGFITIPLLSFVAFTVINLCLIFFRRKAD